jgi:hypothetical protein
MYTFAGTFTIAYISRYIAMNETTTITSSRL